MLKFIDLFQVRHPLKVKRLNRLLEKISSDLLNALWVCDPEQDVGYLIHYYDVDLDGEDIFYLNKHLEPHGYILTVATSLSNALCITPI